LLFAACDKLSRIGGTVHGFVPVCIEKVDQSNYFIVRPKVDETAGQLSLPHVGITKTEKNRIKT